MHPPTQMISYYPRPVVTQWLDAARDFDMCFNSYTMKTHKNDSNSTTIVARLQYYYKFDVSMDVFMA
jgi:hypothetical protein